MIGRRAKLPERGLFQLAFAANGCVPAAWRRVCGCRRCAPAEPTRGPVRATRRRETPGREHSYVESSLRSIAHARAPARERADAPGTRCRSCHFRTFDSSRLPSCSRRRTIAPRWSTMAVTARRNSLSWRSKSVGSISSALAVSLRSERVEFLLQHGNPLRQVAPLPGLFEMSQRFALQVGCDTLRDRVGDGRGRCDGCRRRYCGGSGRGGGRWRWLRADDPGREQQDDRRQRDRHPADGPDALPDGCYSSDVPDFRTLWGRTRDVSNT